jgi:phosphoadenosine phosphosulfate reductase
LIPTYGLPMMNKRFCCKILKENGGSGRLVITGVRAKESTRRSKRKMFEVCYNDNSKRFLHAIFDWSEDDVWRFLGDRPHCSLYDEGFSRIGCIMCPMSRKQGMTKAAERWPKYYQAYLRAAEMFLKYREEKGLDCYGWKTAQEVIDWWISGEGQYKTDPNQTRLFFE